MAWLSGGLFAGIEDLAGSFLAEAGFDAASEVASTELPSDVAGTFTGRVHQITLQSDVTAFRYSGGTSLAKGHFLTTAQTVANIGSEAVAKSALNLPPDATAETLNSFIIPQGTDLFVGRVAGGARWATQIWMKNYYDLIPK